MSDELATKLIRDGHVNPDQIREAESMLHRDDGMTLGEALVKLGYCSGIQIAKALSAIHQMAFCDLDTLQIPTEVLELVPESMARENNVIPITEIPHEGDTPTLVVALADPRRIDLMDSLRFILNRRMSFQVAAAGSITAAINQHYCQTEGESIDSLVQEMTETQIDFEYVSQDGEEMQDDAEARSPAARIVDLMIREALQLGASDIHVEPFDNRVRVRYRIDGKCQFRSDLPRRIHSNVISRIMILARMDMTNRRTPSDGRIRTQVGDKRMDLRVNIVPTNHGLSCVMRLLDRDSISVGIRQLGMADADYEKFVSLTRRPNGIVLVTGPTGSGKTTTLYAALKSLNTPTRKIITAEDPVEYNLPGVNQVEVNHDRGLDFAAIVRSMLRQAPNVILVGEIRDHETAEMALQAAQTGHLVLSTLHTNDAPSAVSRLVEMGIPGYKISSGVTGVLAQRLVRTICQRCKVSRQPSPELLQSTHLDFNELNDARFSIGRGCGYCGGQGYRGRIGVYELMPINGHMRRMIDDGASTMEIRRAAIESGMTTLFEDGMRKAAAGITTIEEIHRVATSHAVEEAIRS